MKASAVFKNADVGETERETRDSVCVCVSMSVLAYCNSLNEMNLHVFVTLVC